MTDDDYKTMRVPKDAWEAAKAQKEAAGRTWGEQIVRPPSDTNAEETDTADHAENIAQVTDPSSADIDALARDVDDVLEELNDLHVLLDRLPNRAAERTAEELEGRFA